MDFIDRIKDSINTSNNLPIQLRTGYLGAEESLVVYSIPGSTTVQEYMDGARDINLNYEIAYKSKDGDLAESTLWEISSYIEKVKELKSKDKSFKFNSITIPNRPFSNDYGEQKWFVFLLDFTANITTKEEI